MLDCSLHDQRVLFSTFTIHVDGCWNDSMGLWFYYPPFCIRLYFLKWANQLNDVLSLTHPQVPPLKPIVFFTLKISVCMCVEVDSEEGKLLADSCSVYHGRRRRRRGVGVGGGKERGKERGRRRWIEGGRWRRSQLLHLVILPNNGGFLGQT